MWGNILGGLMKPLGDIFKAREARKTVKVEAQANLDRILAEAASADATVAGQIALVNAQNQNNTWKDEYALLVVTSPVVALMLLSVVEALGVPVDSGSIGMAMFTALDTLPAWWSDTFRVAVWAALGITGFKKVLG